MDFSFTEKEESFRDELRQWLEANLPEGWLEGKREIPEGIEEQRKFFKGWQKKLFEGNWSGISWPREYGGRGASLIEEVIYEQEMARVKAPPQINAIGVAMVGPTLLQIGTKEQKERYVHKILNGEEIWCQGYSEPNSGSDLASLQTTAVKKGDKWVINGQKIWTSVAHLADRCFVLARTKNTGKKHEGITAFLIDMEQEGVELKGIRSIDDRKDFNEVFLNDAIAYEADVVGEVNDGWRVSLILLSHERTGVARQIFQLQKTFDEVVELANTMERGGVRLIENPIIRQKIAKLKAKSRGLLLNYYRNLTNTIKRGYPGPEGSMEKLGASELGQEIYDFALSLHGSASTLWKNDALVSGEWQRHYLRSRAYTIEGGTSDIQRNIVAERVLGLPKDIKY
ncbi:acyl-CoA dehydrogenase family protein [Oceanobacillus longus]|uniref:Acyl-CoA dehydrogenase family protein n=1 Tax=Oceanobacillus longus TaxID=930120 RepID=A0ABV8H1C6_9BACI